MERDAEIAQIKHELEILRARYALYERWGRILRTFFMVGVPLAIFLIAAKLISTDPLMGVFFLGMCAVIGALFWLSGNGPVRWADVASMRGLPISMSPGIPHPYGPRGRTTSDARLIEGQIAEREQRLLELGVQP